MTRRDSKLETLNRAAKYHMARLDDLTYKIAAELDAPEDIFGDDDVICADKVYELNPKRYTFVYLKKMGHWYGTGIYHNRKQTWEDLLDFHGAAELKKAFVVRNWTEAYND